MELSVGTVITDGTKFLVCHATEKSFWDLPKGRKDLSDDSTLETAIRELYEETNINYYDSSKFKPLGKYKYIPGKKDLYLYFIYDEKCIERANKSELRCNSYYEGGKPEVDAYKFIKFDEAETYCTINMQKIIKQVSVLLHTL